MRFSFCTKDVLVCIIYEYYYKEGGFIMRSLDNVKKKSISSRSPKIINDYINNINNMDEHTLKAKNSNITETLISSQHLAGSDIHHVSMGMEVTIKSVRLFSWIS